MVTLLFLVFVFEFSYNGAPQRVTHDSPVTLQSNELVFPVASSQLLSNTELLQIRQCADHVHHMSAC